MQVLGLCQFAPEELSLATNINSFYNGKIAVCVYFLNRIFIQRIYPDFYKAKCSTVADIDLRRIGLSSQSVIWIDRRRRNRQKTLETSVSRFQLIINGPDQRSLLVCKKQCLT